MLDIIGAIWETYWLFVEGGGEVKLFQNAIIISSTILTFLPDNPLYFYTKNAQKADFPLNLRVYVSSNCAYNIEYFIDSFAR